MSGTVAGLLQLTALLVALAGTWFVLGDYMARTYSSDKHWGVERALYRVMGVEPGSDQRWPVYAGSLLAFSGVSVLFLYGLQRVQHLLPLSLGFDPVEPYQAWNTAVSFVTNTNWQSYSGEVTMGHLTQMAGLAVQNFLSAAVGMAVAVALIRGFTRSRSDRLGNFWVDLTRGALRILLPISIVGAVVLIAGGVIQNLSEVREVATLTGGTQPITGGPVASQEVIKELGTNGGGFYNANSAHPFENPSPFTNLFEIFLLLAIPVALTRTFGRMVGNVRQGVTLLAVMSLLWGLSLAGVWIAEATASGDAQQLAGGAMEGKETRFGVPGSALFAVSTTMTSTGAVNSFHDSYSPLGGGLLLLNILLGEITPGGVGAGLYGILILAILTVFLGGLMVGRTPEYLGKKIRAKEIQLVALYILVMPTLVLIGTALALSFPETRASILAGNEGQHGLSEVLYAFASASNNNGSAFAGLTVNTEWYNTALGVCMLLGRFLPIVLVLALAGSLAGQQPVPVGSGTLPTASPLFASLVVGVIVIVAALTFIPALALGPIAEGLS